jgi:branched-chain amino acid transport system substrate-binding protein
MVRIDRRRGRRRPVLALAIAGWSALSLACGSMLPDEELRLAEAGETSAIRADDTVAARATNQADNGAASEAAAPVSADSGPASGSGDSGALAGGSGVAARPGSPGQPAAAPKTTPGTGSPTGGGRVGEGPASTGPSPSEPTGDAGVALPVERKEIRLGSFGQESGPLGAIFVPMVHAAKAWVADINSRGGLAGHPVKITFIDDGGDPGRALAAARRLVEEDKVVAFYGTHAGATLQGALRYIEERKIPVLGACGCNSATDPSPMVFEAGVTAPIGNAWMHMMPLLSQSDRRKVALFYCREAQTCPNIADAIKSLAGKAQIEIVYESGISIAAPDYTAEVIAARSAGANATILVSDNPTVVRMASSAKRQGWDTVISANHATHETRFLEFGSAADGILTGSIVAPWDSSPKMADYRAAMDRWVPGGVKASLGAQTWVLGKVLELIAPRFGAEVTSQQILDGLHSLDRETLGGIIPPTTWRPGVGHADTNQCTIPIRVEKGRFLTPFGEEFRCAPGWQPIVRGS